MVALKKPSLKRNLMTQTILTVAISAAFGLGFAPIAQADALDNLIEKLKEKGVISEDEYQEVIEVREGERAVARKRRQEESEKNTKAEDRAKTEMVGNFSDGIRWESADKKNSIGVNGRLQLDYRNFSGDDRLQANTFDVRRAYLGVNGKFWDYYSFDVTADFAQTTSPQLDVAWLNVAWWKPVQFRFGQFKMPMSLEELTSSRFIDFQERSLMNSFIPAKERGIMVHGEPTTGMFYGLALSTGQGKNNNEADVRVDSNDIIGRVGVNIAEMVGQKNAVYHVAAAYSTGEVPSNLALAGRTEGRGITFFNASSSGTPAVNSFTGNDLERTRQLLEASVAIGPVKFQSEFLRSKYEGNSSAGVSFDREIDVWYAQALWLITGEKYADAYRSGAYGRIRPKNNFSPKGGGWGAWELGLRYTNFDASDFRATNPAGTGVLNSASLTNEARAYTVGLKWLPTPNTRFLLNLIKTDFETPVTSNGATTDEEKAVTFRAQFDF
ncbi:MAG: porin [Burkholderiales bacterium]